MNIKLENRYLFTAVLTMKTGLHIGGGSDVFATDSPVIRDAYGKPFIPGSSFKGVLRSSVEKIIPNFESISNVWSCQLFGEGKHAAKCFSTNKKLQQKLANLYSETSIKIKDSKELTTEEKEKYAANPDDIITERFLLEQFMPDNLCSTCKIFGSPVLGSKIKIQDLLLRESFSNSGDAENSSDLLEVETEIRDGVAIDRDTGIAVDQAKFDYEVVPSQTEFTLQIILEDVSDQDLALFAVGISEFTQEGSAAIGGLTSRGLGACFLENIKIKFVDFSKTEHLEEYLINKNMNGELNETAFFNLIKTNLLTN